MSNAEFNEEQFKRELDEAVAPYRADAERWRKALAAYERGVEMSHDGRTGEVDGYISLFLAAIRERDGTKQETTR